MEQDFGDALIADNGRGFGDCQRRDGAGCPACRYMQEWEQGRRKPNQAARAYLTVIARNPEAVEAALSTP